jgi:tetratricopeptide (TPR) repeat protein
MLRLAAYALYIGIALCVSSASAFAPSWAQSPLTELPADLQLPDGFEEFYNLDYDLAIEKFQRGVREHPNQPDGYNYLAQAILFRHLFRTGALESQLVSGNNPFLRRPKTEPSPEDQRAFDAAVARAIQLTEQRLQTNPEDPAALYAQGIALGFRANYNFLVRKAWRDALRDATAARKLHNRVSRLDPSQVDARMVQGLHDYVVGSLPLSVRLIGFLVGFRGDREEGVRTIEQVAQYGRRNRLDARILLAVIYRRERQPDKAIPLVAALSRRFPGNFLYRLELAQMYSDAGKKKEALAVLEEVAAMKRKGHPGFERLETAKIFYNIGNIQFWYNDLDDAMANMRHATSHYETLDLNTAGLAWMRLGQLHDMKGNRQEAMQAYRKAISASPQSDAAQECRKYLNQAYRRSRKG